MRDSGSGVKVIWKERFESWQSKPHPLSGAQGCREACRPRTGWQDEEGRRLPPRLPRPRRLRRRSSLLKHLAAQLAESHELPKKHAEALLDDVVGLLVDHLKAGDRLRISGLGVLEVKDRPARSGRNPATGATIEIAASKKIAFRAAKELKEAI